MLVVGLTGGIGSGKSAVLSMLEEMGARTIDLDEMSRVVVEPGEPAWLDIVRHFPEGVVKPNGTLDREALGRIVFSDPQSRKTLEAFVHPRILAEQDRMLKEIEKTDSHAVVIIDVPLLIEFGLQEKMDAVILVHIPRAMQLERLIRRDGLSSLEAEARLESQMPIDDKILFADFVIDNSGDVEQTRRQAKKLMETLKDREKRERLAEVK